MTTAAIRTAEAISERIETEIKAMRNGLHSQLNQRRDHPSHGITKAMLKAQLHQIEGALKMWLIVIGAWGHSGAPYLSHVETTLIRRHLDVDFNALQRAVNNA